MIRMQKKIMSSTGAIILAAACLVTTACSRRDPAPYEVSSGTLQMGSLYYAQAGCARCHGEKWDGKSSEAVQLEKQGTPVKDFRQMRDPETTPVDYFRVITGGTPKFKNHTFHQYTDAGRWAMAHFLYSLAPRVIGSKQPQREEALVREMAEAARAYAEAGKQGNRRWQAGFFQPVAERLPAPALTDLLKANPPAPEQARGIPDGDRMAAVHRAEGRGRDLFASACAECHGTFGEGGPAGIRLGTIACKSATGRCGVVFSSPDIRGRAGRFASKHGAEADGVLPRFLTMPAEDVAAIFAFLEGR